MEIFFDSASQEWLAYNKKNGLYQKVATVNTGRSIDSYITPSAKAYGVKLGSTFFGKVKKEIAPYMAINTVADAQNILTLKNCTFNLDTFRAEPHSPDNHAVAAANVTYITVRKGGKEAYQKNIQPWLTFLNSVTQDAEDIKLLQQFIGYCLTPRTDLQKGLYIIGPGGTGKSTFTHVVTKLLGDYATSSSANGLANESHSLERHISSRLIVINEIMRQESTDGIKNIIGEDAITINPKYKKPYSATLPAKIIVTANNWLHLGDDADNDSWLRRFEIVKFENSFQDAPDPTLRDRLTTPESLSAILMWALQGYVQLFGHPDVPEQPGARAFELRQSQVQSRLEQSEDANPTITFASERLVYREDDDDAASRASLTDVYEEWERWADEAGHHRGSRRRFYKRLESGFKELGWKQVKQIKTMGSRYYTNIYLPGTKLY